MGLVIAPAHRTDHLFDEIDFSRSDPVSGVQVFVGPLLRPRLGGHEGVDLACDMLGWLVQENQKARQPAGEIGQGAFGLASGIKRADAEIGFRGNTARFPEERCADDSVRVGVLVAGAWRSIPGE